MTAFLEILAKALEKHGQGGPCSAGIGIGTRRGCNEGFFKTGHMGGILSRGHCLGKGVEMGRLRHGRGGPVWAGRMVAKVGPCECGDFTPGPLVLDGPMQVF